MHILGFSISNYSDLVIEQNESHFFMRIYFSQLLYLRLNGAQNALFPRDESFIFILSSG